MNLEFGQRVAILVVKETRRCSEDKEGYKATGACGISGKVQQIASRSPAHKTWVMTNPDKLYGSNQIVNSLCNHEFKTTPSESVEPRDYCAFTFRKRESVAVTGTGRA